MPISDVPILSMLRTKMQWHQERQRLLAENVANADTANFRPRDLTPLEFKQTAATQAGGTVALAPPSRPYRGVEQCLPVRQPAGRL